MSQVRQNDQEFLEAMREMWYESFKARKVATAVYSRPESTQDDRLAFLLARQREQAIWEAYEKVRSVVVDRSDRVLAELRGEG